MAGPDNVRTVMAIAKLISWQCFHHALVGIGWTSKPHAREDSTAYPACLKTPSPPAERPSPA
jgi:hypothetical protein